MKINQNNGNGFTLVELAVVMVLIGIVMTMGLKMVVATLDNAAHSETKSKQERIKIALISYLRTNGKLPCPDNTAGIATGAAAVICATNIADGYGVVPWQTLGIPREAAIDGWGNYFTYVVANGVNPIVKNWTSKTNSGDFSINELKAPSVAFGIQELDATGAAFAPLTTSNAVVVIISHGANGYGAKTTQVAARMPQPDPAALGEIANGSSATTTFVLRPVSVVPAAFNGAYDDLLTYMLPQDLLQPLVSEGTLKSCAGYCSASASSVCSGTGTCLCTGPGLPGTPDAATPCSGACSTCTTSLLTANCKPTGPIPVGSTPANCI